MVNVELTGKRDLHYSRRHREYGYRAVMYDIDSIEFSYDTCEPVACIETKCGLITTIDLNSYQFNCLEKTAARLGVPLLCVIYYNFNSEWQIVAPEADHSVITHVQYYVLPVNDLSRLYVPKPSKMSEKDYVSLLYKFRGEALPPDLKLCDSFVHAPGMRIPAITLRYPQLASL